MNAAVPRLLCLHEQYGVERSYGACTGRYRPLRRDYDEKGNPMKVRNSLRSLKNRPGAQIVRRRGKVYVINRKDPRSKARQG